MFTNPRSRKNRIRVVVIIGAILLIITGTRYALADKNTTLSSQDPGSYPLVDPDDGYNEVGIEWINDFPEYEYDLAFKGDDCIHLYDNLINSGWWGYFNYGNSDAMSADFKLIWHFGREDNYVDHADIAMLCTRGVYAYDPAYGYIIGPAFTKLGSWDSLTPFYAEQAYGDKDLEWLAIAASSILTDTSRSYWASTMNGLHLLLGYQSHDHLASRSEGEVWADYMLGSPSCLVPRTITQAWFHMVDDIQVSEACARVLAERHESFSDHLWGKGFVSDDAPVDEAYSYATHCSTGPASKQLLSAYDQPEVLAMPVVQVIDRVVDQAYVMNTIAPAFTLEDEEPCFYDNKYAISKIIGGNTLTLEVDQATGAFSFQKLGSLWTVPVITPTLPSEGVAAGLIDEWFRNTPALYLPGAGYRNAGYEYRIENFVGMVPKGGTLESEQSQPLSVLPANIAMTYPRILVVASLTTDGIQEVNYPVLGPGGRMQIYLGDAGDIIGAQGGSRDLHVMGDVVTVIDSNVVWQMFLDNPHLAIGEIDITADLITHTVPSLGYYEMPYPFHQDDLIPVWEFRGYFYSGGILVAGDVPIYLPAANEYMPPQVAILNPPAGSVFWSSEQITFNGSITGGTPPYTIEWISSKDGFLGDTLNIIAMLTSPVKEGNISSQTVSFIVTDANGLTSSAEVNILIKPVFWLPGILK